MSPASHLNRTVYSGRTTCPQSRSSITSLSQAVRPTIVFRNDGLTNRTRSHFKEAFRRWYTVDAQRLVCGLGRLTPDTVTAVLQRLQEMFAE
jgi:hypothetical protein